MMTSRSGMTLIELLVALTLASIVSMTGYAVFGAAIDARASMKHVMEPVSKAASMRGLLINWIGAAHTTGAENGVEFNGADATGENVVDVLTFLTNDARPLTNSPALMRLTIDTDSATRERGLVADVWYGNDGHRRMSLLPEASTMNLAYYGEIEGVTKWWPSWRSSVRLPSAVRLSIGTVDSVRTVSGIPIVILMAPTQ